MSSSWLTVFPGGTKGRGTPALSPAGYNAYREVITPSYQDSSQPFPGGRRFQTAGRKWLSLSDAIPHLSGVFFQALWPLSFMQTIFFLWSRSVWKLGNLILRRPTRQPLSAFVRGSAGIPVIVHPEFPLNFLFYIFPFRLYLTSLEM